jgi:RNA polymerase sigma-70 factor (ECF subfamily)
MSDAELVRQVLGGQTAAYAELMRRHAGRVHALCLARVWRLADAEELAQEAAYRGLRDLATLRDPGLFGRWLCRIARNVCANWRKDRDNAHLSLSRLGDRAGLCACPERSGWFAVDQADEVRRLMEEVRALPEEYREALTLYYSQRLTYAELAELLEVSPATVNYRLTRARELLRERLGRA